MLHVISGTGEQHEHYKFREISSFLFQNIAKNNSNVFQKNILIYIYIYI
jgi:hypothetical protein